MANLTLSIDEDLLRRARIRALELNTSVNSAVRDYLQQFAMEPNRRSQMEEFLEWARTVHGGSGPDGRTWTRDELYER